MRALRPLPSLLLGGLLLAGTFACGDDSSGDDGGGAGGGAPNPADRPRGGPAPMKHCPGAEGCMEGGDGTLRAGAAKIDVTPRGFEQVKPDYLDSTECPEGHPGRCGYLVDPLSFRDCGTDKLCSNDAGYAGPDADGSEGDDVLDYFRDCGFDDKCPGEAGYTAPDEGEGNGRFDGHWIAGFSTNRPMLGSHDPIWARAFAMQSGDVTVAWVVVDSVGFFWNNLDNPPDDPETIAKFPEQATRPGIRQRVKALAPELEIDLVVAGSTHTHEAPDTMGQWGFADQVNDGGLPTTRGVNDQWLFDQVIEGAAQAVIEAVRGLRPAKAYLAKGETGFEGVVHDSRDPVIYDDAVQLLRFAATDDGATIATVVNWASHPEVLWSENNLSTSDYVHYVREGLENGLPAAGGAPAREGLGGVAVFIQGPVGGLIGPGGATTLKARDGGEVTGKTFARAQANGEWVAEAAFAALETEQEVAPEFLEFATELVKLPIDNTLFQVAALSFGLFARPYYDFDDGSEVTEFNRPKLRSELGVIRLGRVTFATFPGELFPELAVGFGEEHRFGHPFASEDNPNPPDEAQIATLSPPPYLEAITGGAEPDATFLCGLTFDEIGYIVPSYDFQVGDVPYLVEPEGDHYEETNSLGPETVELVVAAHKRISRWSSPVTPSP